MTKWLFPIVFVAISCIALGAYIGDWGNFKLRNTGYKFSTRHDYDHVWIVREKDGTAMTGQNVVDFEKQGNYLFFLQLVANSVDCYDENDVATIITLYTDKKLYWIVDTAKNEEIGPLEEAKFKQWLRYRNVEVSLDAPENYLSDYVNESKFQSMIKHCSKVVPEDFASYSDSINEFD